MNRFTSAPKKTGAWSFRLLLTDPKCCAAFTPTEGFCQAKSCSRISSPYRPLWLLLVAAGARRFAHRGLLPGGHALHPLGVGCDPAGGYILLLLRMPNSGNSRRH
jgi:hypothetical protein